MAHLVSCSDSGAEPPPPETHPPTHAPPQVPSPSPVSQAPKRRSSTSTMSTNQIIQTIQTSTQIANIAPTSQVSPQSFDIDSHMSIMNANKQFLEEQIEALQANDGLRWNFDFRAGRPRNSNKTHRYVYLDYSPIGCCSTGDDAGSTDHEHNEEDDEEVDDKEDEEEDQGENDNNHPDKNNHQDLEDGNSEKNLVEGQDDVKKGVIETHEPEDHRRLHHCHQQAQSTKSHKQNESIDKSE